MCDSSLRYFFVLEKNEFSKDAQVPLSPITQLPFCFVNAFNLHFFLSKLQNKNFVCLSLAFTFKSLKVVMRKRIRPI